MLVHTIIPALRRPRQQDIEFHPSLNHIAKTHRKIVDFSETIQIVVLQYRSLHLNSLNFCGAQKSRWPTQERKMTARKNVINAGTGSCLDFLESEL